MLTRYPDSGWWWYNLIGKKYSLKPRTRKATDEKNTRCNLTTELTLDVNAGSGQETQTHPESSSFKLKNRSSGQAASDPALQGSLGLWLAPLWQHLLSPQLSVTAHDSAIRESGADRHRTWELAVLRGPHPTCPQLPPDLEFTHLQKDCSHQQLNATAATFQNQPHPHFLLVLSWITWIPGSKWQAKWLTVTECHECPVFNCKHAGYLSQASLSS